MDEVVALAEAAHHVGELLIIHVVHARPLVRQEPLPPARERRRARMQKLGFAHPAIHECSVLAAEGVGWKVAKTWEVEPLRSDDGPLAQNLPPRSALHAVCLGDVQ